MENRHLDEKRAARHNMDMPPRPLQDLDASSVYRARWLVLLAAVLWSTSGLFAKAEVFANWPETGWLPQRGMLLVFWRALFAAAVLAPFVRRPTWTWKLIPAALAFLLMNVTYLSAMVQTSAANAIWLQNTAPLWVFLIGTTVLRDPVHPRDRWQLGFIVAGLTVILSYELQSGEFSGVLWGVAAGVGYAAVVLSLRWLRSEDAAWLVAFNHGATALVLLPYVAATGPAPTSHQLVFLAAFGAVQMGIPYLLFARGLRSVPAHEAAGIVLIEPILVPLWVWLVGMETPRWWTIAGGAFIGAGLAARYFRMPALRPRVTG